MVHGLPFPRRKVLFLFLLALALRTAFVMHHARLGWQLHYDPGMYLTLAENLRHGVYSMFHPMDIPDTIKMPGYPALLWLLGGNVMAVLLVQALISALKVPLVFLLARRVGLRLSFALATAALMAVEPVDILLAGQVLTESLFTALVLGGSLLLLQGTRWRPLLLAAVLFATAAWVRPNGLWLMVLAGVASWLFVHRDLPKAVAFTALGLLLLAPWAWRNHRTLDRFYMGDSGAVAAAYYQVPDVLHAANDPRAATWPRTLHDRAASTDWEDRASFHAFFDGLRSDVRNTLTEHPLTWGRVHLVKAAKIFAAPGRGHIRSFFGGTPVAAYPLLALSLAFSALLVIALAGWLVYIRQLPPWLWMLLLFAVYMIVTGALTTTDARFKNPAMPLLIVGAMWAMEHLSVRAKPRTRRSIAH